MKVGKLRPAMNSIFSRLFITFVLIMAPILISSMVVFSWGKNAIQSEIKNSASAHVEYIQYSMESEVNRVKKLQYDLINDKYLNKLANEFKYLPEYEYYTLISDLQSRLAIMSNSSIFIEDVSVIFPQMNCTVSAKDNLGNINNEEVIYILDKIKGRLYPVIFDQSGIYNVIAYPAKNDYSDRGPLFLIKVRFSRQALSEYIAQFNNQYSGDTFLFDHSGKTWLAGSKNGLREQELIDFRPDDHLVNSKDRMSVVNGNRYMIISGYSKYLNASFLKLIPVDDIYRVPNRYSRILWFFSVMSFFIIVLYSFFTYKFVYHPIRKILDAFKTVEAGNLQVKVFSKAANEFEYLYDGFNKMVWKLNELINNVYKQELYAKNAQLKQLQSQINPHFLYNSYFMLHRLISDKDFEDAFSLSAYLGKYFQYITRDAADDVPLCQEAEHAKSYTEIQVMRFAGRITVEFEPLPDNTGNIPVPRMILQPILENAFNYGTTQTVSGYRIRVRFMVQEDILKIIIEDSGADLSDLTIGILQKKLEEMGDHVEITGMINVHRRIRLKFGKESGLSISRSELGGLKAELSIQLHLREEQ